MPSYNQTPEQIARDKIDRQLQQADWAVQDEDKINWQASPGIAVREYPTDTGLAADYVFDFNSRSSRSLLCA